MKILSFSLDKKILDPNSAVSQRTVGYGKLVEKYTVIVPLSENRTVTLAENIDVYGSGGKNKISQLWQIYKFGRQILSAEKYDLITVQDPYFVALVAYWLSRKSSLPIEIQVHGLEKFNGWRKLIAGLVLKKADSVRTVSKRLREFLIAQFNLPSNKIVVVPVYVNTNLPELNRIKRKDGVFIFLTVGRLVPIKNIALQIQAFKIVAKNNNRVKLWVVGSGPEDGKLRKLATDLMPGMVKFWGWQEHVEPFYQQADAFLLTSDYEGWGMAVIEAARYGLPIIMTDTGCAREFIRDNENGLIVPLGDVQVLAGKMARLIDDESLTDVLGRNAQKSLATLLSQEETLVRYLASWQKILESKK